MLSDKPTSLPFPFKKIFAYKNFIYKRVSIEVNIENPISNTLREKVNASNIVLNSNKSIDLKGLGYYIRFYYYIKPQNKFYRFDTRPNRKALTTILLYCKIPFKTLKKRIAKDLNKLGINKDLIEPFCLEIREQIKFECYNLSDLPKKKRKCSASKKLAHIEKKSIFHIASSDSETLQNESIGFGLLDFINLYREIKVCSIVDKKSLINGYKLCKLSYGTSLRIHQYRYGFNIIEWDVLNRPIRDKNLTIWSPNVQSVILSIGSKQDKELCNMELLSEGFKQIAKRYSFLDTLKIVGLLRKKEVNIEIGIDVLNSEKEIKELGFEFLPKTYEIYGLKFWFDKSRNKGIELDFSFNSYLNDIIKAFKLIESFKKNIKSFNTLYEKEINEIIPFEITASKPEITRLRNDLLLKYKTLNEIKDLCGFRYRTKCIIIYNES